MRAGKFASLVLVLVVAAVGTAVSLLDSAIPWLSGLPAVGRLFLTFLSIGLVSAALLVPLGAALDKAVVRLRSYIEASGSAQGRTTIYAGPRWVRPITGAFVSALE